MLWKYQGWKGFWLRILVVATLVTLCASQKIGDPYKILGIHPKASLPEIRKAYRQLAKEWHPDKNEDSNAEARFVEIKQAYELLSDTERRHAYDLYGITNEDDHMYKQRHDYSQYARFSNDPFDEFVTRHFRTQDQDITLFHKLSVTTRHFENTILEKSVQEPALVLFYTDFCFDCVRVAAAWRRLVEALQPVGVTLATVHAGHEASLARRVGIHTVPCLTFVLDKHVYIYKESLQSIPKIFEYMRWRFPYRLVRTITDSNLEPFISDFEDNKVKGLIFEERSTMRLRYLVTAYYYRERVAFGFVDTSSADSDNTSSRYGARRSLDTMVLLKEDSPSPAASLAAAALPAPALRELINQNILLTLPRLSSQSVLETVCPAEWRARRRRLCGVLVAGTGAGGTTGVGAGGAGGTGREALRAAARRLRGRVQLAYVYAHRQPAFIAALQRGSGVENSQMEHRIVVLWRRDPTRVQYEWLNQTWPEGPAHGEDLIQYQERLNETERLLEQMIKRLLRPTETLAYEATLQELVDESAQGWMGRAWSALGAWWWRTARALRGARGLSALSVLATAALVLAAGYFMAYVILNLNTSEEVPHSENCEISNQNIDDRIEEESVARAKQERRRQSGAGAHRRNNNETHSELRLHELRAEKYNGLVRLLKPGCRTIVVLVDMQSRTLLLSKFHKTVWPYRKNKTLLFAYLMVERNIEWFRCLLQMSLGCARELKVNGRNCVGTVLALNSHRKYFCIYHAKHPESHTAHKRIKGMTRSLAGGGGGGGGGGGADPEAGAFIGFDSEHSSDEGTPDPILQDNLLDGLENWLDRLFEGSTHRYYINYWPDMTTK